MVVSLSLSSDAAASPKQKLSAIDSNALVVGIVALYLADTTIRALKPNDVKNDVKTDRIEFAKALAPIVKGCLYV